MILDRCISVKINYATIIPVDEKNKLNCKVFEIIVKLIVKMTEDKDYRTEIPDVFVE